MAASTRSIPGGRLGILGGSFDPPHVAHLVVAAQAHHQLGLDRVLLVPAWRPPHKQPSDLSPAEVRLELARAAAADDCRFEVSDVEIARRLRFSVETVAAVRDTLAPGELWFIIGADSLMALHTWKEPAALVSACRLAVAPRPGEDEERVAAAARERGGVTLLASPPLDVSSTAIRGRVREGRSISYLVPKDVEVLIRRLDLYTDPS